MGKWAEKQASSVELAVRREARRRAWTLVESNTKRVAQGRSLMQLDDARDPPVGSSRHQGLSLRDNAKNSPYKGSPKLQKRGWPSERAVTQFE
jgi:hypothetical protein